MDTTTIGPHVFDNDALKASVTKMLGELPPDREVGLGYAVDTQGVGVAVMWHNHPTNGWQLAGAAAVTRDWTGGVSFGVSGTISK